MDFSFVLPIAFYFSILLLISWWARSRSSHSDLDYFLGQRQFGSFTSMLSVMATETSVATIVIFPAVGMGSGFSLIWLCAGYIAARALIARYYLRKLYTNHSLSIYQTISQENAQGKKILSLSYLLAKFISSGVRFFMAGYALSQLFSLSTSTWLAIIAVVAGIYSIAGGLKAVVVTDQIQGYIILGMGLFLLGHLGQQVSITEALSNAHWINTEFTYSNYLYFLALFIGGMVLTIGTHAADQDLIQRVLATRSLKHAQRALFFSGLAASAVIFLYLCVGVLLGDLNLTGLDAKSPLVSYMAQLKSPPILSAFSILLFAAAMSTLDSAVNSTAAVWKDLFPKHGQAKTWSFVSLSILTLFGFGFIYLNKHQSDFLSLAMGSMNYVNGGLIGLITLFTFSPKSISTRSIVACLVAGFLTTCWATWGPSPAVAWTWTIVLSSLAAMISGLTVRKLERI